jgi:hypothetical protein
MMGFRSLSFPDPPTHEGLFRLIEGFDTARNSDKGDSRIPPARE